ncbi:MAG TPA: UDP-2,3-diacylglucosamine diphosphatase LpxI [bacterium]|nr:UDP-2,3-diacylglucosamine diphosphatase LpxI [bacterium]HPP29625.1 UDP-2,3-diacylglucosamine diphosphatase LpxI [bacterium]
MEKERTGLFISNDELSEYVYKKLKGKGIKVYPISFAPCHFAVSQTFQPGDVTGILGYLKKEKIKKLVFIGRIPPEIIFKEMHSSSDIFLKGDKPLYGERILTDLVSFLKKEDIDVEPLTDILCDELAEEKLYTDIPLRQGEEEDIETGVRFLTDIIKYRAGQSVAVKSGVIIAVEGVEGTDEMIRRAGMYCNEFVVVKIAGRYKDERFDIPVIGPHTIEVLRDAEARVIAVESSRSIIFDRLKTVALCNKNRITLIGIKGEGR